MNKGLKSFGKQKPPNPRPAFKNCAAYAWIKSHRVSHFFHIGANFFAQIGDHVGVADFQRKKRIGSMLDQFRAVDGGDQERCLMIGRTRAVVNRAMKTVLQNRVDRFRAVASREESSSTPTTMRSG